MKRVSKKDLYKMILVQEPRSNQCGQHCFAMVTGYDLERVFELYGSRSTTYTGDTVKLLSNTNLFEEVKCHKIDNRKRNALSCITPLALLRLQFKGRKMGHLVVHWQGYILDPMGRIYSNLDACIEDYDFRGHPKVSVSHVISLKQKEHAA